MRLEAMNRAIEAIAIGMAWTLAVGSGGSAAQAKPLSYVGGTMVMVENDETGNSASVDYTFSPRFAAALYLKHEIGGDRNFTVVGPQLNALVKRWNLEE